MAGKVGILGLMFLVMFALKLTGAIALSWWIVTAPLWVGAALVCSLIVAVAAWQVHAEEKAYRELRKRNGR